MCHLILFLPVFGLAVFLIWPLSMAAPAYALIFLLSLAMYVLIIKAMRQPVVTGTEAMLCSIGTVVGAEGDHWRIEVGNEIWEAESTAALQTGDRVQVTGIDGLILKVNPVAEPANVAMKN